MGEVFCEVEVSQGVLRGVDCGGAAAFHGVPYASDGGRFRAALPPEGWEGVRDATRPAPVFPQFKGKFKVVIDGERTVLDQREDAFILNIWTPASAPGAGAGLPVVFWLHGGGWATGGCALPEYDGAALARTGRAVFVAANYRLGALGSLCLPGASDGNLALLDVVKALEWVQENIAAFGGDPNNVTLSGQSAGAWMALAAAASGRADGLFAKLMLQSLPAQEPLEEAVAADRAARLVAKLGLADAGELASIPAERILDAQAAVGKDVGQPFAFLPFTAGEDAASVGPDPIGRAIAQLGEGIPLLDGVTADETAFFLARSADAIRTMPDEALAGLMAGFAPGIDPAAALVSAREATGEEDRYRLVIEATSRAMFWDAGERIARGFTRSFGYLMDFRTPASPVGACHCVDLPFFFANPAQFGEFPMMAGADPAAADGLAARFSDAVLSFAETGDPGWPVYKTEADRRTFA